MADGGKFKGSRDPGVEYFDDIMGDNSVPEMFRTDMGGLADFERVQTTASPQGMQIHMHCRPPGCGKPRLVHVGWDELLLLAQAPQTNILPPGWLFSEHNRSPIPNIRCSCGQMVAPVVTPQWAQKEVQSALASGLLTEQQLMQMPLVQQLQQRIAAQRQHMPPPNGGGWR